ncbi:hypothetical protein AB0395_12205 [Streptosporangium sp. NPDC051023]|uniref:hypothetical protein n=1 Tax=Streptosporangium sp. NPDC051023 TaxID=3155410 RepID=UPI003450C0DF
MKMPLDLGEIEASPLVAGSYRMAGLESLDPRVLAGSASLMSEVGGSVLPSCACCSCCVCCCCCSN